MTQPHTHDFPFSLKNASNASLERLEDRNTAEDLDIADSEELKQLADSLDLSNPNFESELNYEGYRTIEESDNDSLLSLDLEREADEDLPGHDPSKELVIEDREDTEVELESGEESRVDPQENKKSGAW